MTISGCGMERRAAQSISLAEGEAEITQVLATARQRGTGTRDGPARQHRRLVQQDLGREVLGPEKSGGSTQPDTRAGAEDPTVPECPDRAGLRPPEADQLNGEVPDGALQGLHGERGVPGVAHRGDAPGDLLNQSQGGMYIRGAMKIGLVAPVKPSHPYLENGPAPLFDLQDDCKVRRLDRRGGRWSASGGRRRSWLAGTWTSGGETILPAAGRSARC